MSQLDTQDSRNGCSGMVAAIAVLMGIIAFWFVCYTESVLPLNPLIETTVPAGFKLENFEQIQPGMTKAEVLQLIPPPFKGTNSPFWYYGGEKSAGFGDFAHFELTINFTSDGKVAKTNKITLHD